MELSDYLSALVRGWWLIVIFALVGLTVGLLLPRPSPAQLVSETHYVSSSSVGSPPPAPGNGGNQFGGGISPDQMLYYATSDSVISLAAKIDGLNEPPYVVRSQITLIPPSDASSSSSGATSGLAGVIDVQVIGPTSAAALNLNNAFDGAMQIELEGLASSGLKEQEQDAQQTLLTIENEIATNTYPLGLDQQALEVQVGALQNHLADLVVEVPSTGFQVIQQPSAQTVSSVKPSTTTTSRPLRAAAGLLIGLVVGVLAALALWLLDRRLKTAKRALVAFGYPVVAEIPADASDATEPYRMLWLSVFREPLPLPPAEQNQRLYDGEDPMLDEGVRSTSGPGGSS